MRGFVGRLGWRSGLLIVVVLSAAGGIAYASVPDSAGVYTACKLNSTGTIRLIDPSIGGTSLLGHCTSLETQISWNQLGQPGPKGLQGDPGATGAQGPAGPQGATGDKGDTGPQGPQGEQGIAGTPGVAGTNGASAYDVWLSQGHSGTVNDFLTSLKGDTGAAGDPGPQGPTGPVGPTGPAGSEAAPPTIASVVSSTAFTSVPDSVWHSMPGVAVTITLNASSPVELASGTSVLLNGVLATRITVDGAPVSGTQRIVGTTSYASSSAVAFKLLSAGTHVVSMQYRSPSTFSFDPNQDFQTASLQALCFDQ